MTAALPISHKRLADVILRYGITCSLTPPLVTDEDAPWKVSEIVSDDEQTASRGVKQKAHILLSSVIERSILQQAEHQKQASALLVIAVQEGEVSHGALIEADGLSWSIKQLVLIDEGQTNRIYKIELMTNEV